MKLFPINLSIEARVEKDQAGFFWLWSINHTGIGVQNHTSPGWFETEEEAEKACLEDMGLVLKRYIIMFERRDHG